jgi:hypothetical protein
MQQTAATRKADVFGETVRFLPYLIVTVIVTVTIPAVKPKARFGEHTYTNPP